MFKEFLEKQFFRNNKNLKAANAKEYITEEEMQRRALEIIKCRNDVAYFAENYFTITSRNKGTHLISLYPKQRDMVNFMVENDRVIICAPRQCGKTTGYTIAALWYTMFNHDKRVLICANRFKTAIEFIGRIQLAYTSIPGWLKPGLTEWNKSSIGFSNNSTIMGDATSEQSGRGSSCNFLLLDEFAFTANTEAFWSSVYPVISSAKGTKVVIVSTPNGTGNLYYEIWNRAQLGIDDEGWKPFSLRWQDVPGRDEEWRKKQLASFNNDATKFAQEFGNCFIGSSMTLLDATIINRYKEAARDIPAPVEYRIDNLESFKLNVWKKPSKDRTYIIGADVAEGVGGDFSTILVFDCTRMSDIELVASSGSNSISTSEFSYMLFKVCKLYNDAFLAVECNSIGKAVTDALTNNYDYDNLLTFGSKDPTKVGVYSHQSVKNFACLWLKDLMNIEEIKIKLTDKNLIHEIEWFEKKKGSIKSGFAAVSGKHDDYMMSFIWAMLAINPTIVENYFTVDKYFTTSYGKVMPASIRTSNHSHYVESNDWLDDKFTEENSRMGKLMRDNVSSEDRNINSDDGKIEQDANEDGGAIGFFGDGNNDEFDSGGSWN